MESGARAGRHYVVCGLGIVGFRIVELLHRLGERVVVISQSAREEWLEATRGAGIEVITGDARDPTMLERAGLASAAAVVAVTGKDLVNIEIALDVKRLRRDATVVVRLFDQALARRLEETFDVRRALSMATLAAPSFAAAAIGSGLIGSLAIGGELFVVGNRREVRGRGLEGSTPAELGRELEVAVVREPTRREGREGV